MIDDKIYVYDEIGPWEFRLLQLQLPDDKIECSLHTFDRDHSPSYFALSYCWGSDVPSAPIFCDRQKLLVTKNLLHGLRELSQPQWNVTGSAPWFWIDAVCINQLNNEEKSDQVEAMGNIFSNADRVLVWLGPAEDNSNLAMECLPSIVACMSVTATIPNLFGEAMDRLPSEDDPVWPAVYALFNRPYFRRGWMIQEIVLAREITVLCGEMIVPWNTLSEFASDVSSALPATLLVKDPSYQGRNSRTGRASCSLLQQLKNNIVDGQLNPTDRAALLWIAAGKEFTDPRDRVNALFGFLPHDLQTRMRVNYAGRGHSVVEVGKAMLSQIPNLFILSLKQPSSSPGTLPSWCPDFHSQLVSLNTLSHFNGFRAGIRALGFVHPPDVRECQQSDWVGINGFILDTVQTVATLKLPIIFDVNTRSMHSDFPAQLLAWESHCRRIFHETHRRKLRAETLEGYSRALTANHFNFDDPIPPKHDMYKDYLSCMRGALIMATGLVEQEYKPLVVSEGSMSRYVSALEAHSSRKFFNTHHGRIGLGPDNMQLGDLICVLYSGIPLYVLRWDRKTSSHKYVGEAYLHGCMDLDTMFVPERGRDQMFWIS